MAASTSTPVRTRSGKRWGTPRETQGGTWPVCSLGAQGSRAPRETQGGTWPVCSPGAQGSWGQHCHFPSGQPWTALGVPAGGWGISGLTSPFTTDTALSPASSCVLSPSSLTRGQTKQKPLRTPRPLGQQHPHQPPPAPSGEGPACFLSRRFQEKCSELTDERARGSFT